MKLNKVKRDHKLISWVEENTYAQVIGIADKGEDSISKVVAMLVKEGLKSYGKTIN